MGAFEQYPDIYKKGTTSYSYYADSGEKLTLEQGKDGVDGAWIERIRQMHREEANMMRRGRSKGAGKKYLLSLTRFEDELSDEAKALIDPAGSVEEQYIAREERKRIRRRIARAYRSLTPEERKLLAAVRFSGRTMTEVATEMGISRQAVSKRLNRAVRRFSKEMGARRRGFL